MKTLEINKVSIYSIYLSVCVCAWPYLKDSAVVYWLILCCLCVLQSCCWPPAGCLKHFALSHINYMRSLLLCITIHLLFLVFFMNHHDITFDITLLLFPFWSCLQACVDLSKWTTLLGSSMVCDPQIQNVSFIIETADSQERCQSSRTSHINVGTVHWYLIALIDHNCLH